MPGADDPEAGAYCPSAQPDIEHGILVGVVGGSASEPRVAYLADPRRGSRTARPADRAGG